jgi:hypothetical protein
MDSQRGCRWLEASKQDPRVFETVSRIDHRQNCTHAHTHPGGFGNASKYRFPATYESPTGPPKTPQVPADLKTIANRVPAVTETGVDNTKPRKLGGEGKNGGRLVPETAWDVRTTPFGRPVSLPVFRLSGLIRRRRPPGTSLLSDIRTYLPSLPVPVSECWCHRSRDHRPQYQRSAVAGRSLTLPALDQSHQGSDRGQCSVAPGSAEARL